MLNPQMTSSQMELLPLVCLCLLSWSGTTSADQPETVAVGEGGDVVLKCSINVNMETGAFEWTKGQKEVFTFDAGQYSQAEQFKGRVSHFQDELKNGNTSIKITNATMDDSGDYTCEFPNNHPSPTFNVKLVVVTGAAPKPSVTIVDETDYWALLQCEAHGVPEPEVHWQDSAGNILPAEKSQVTERGGRKYITLNTTVTKTGHFSCVATQKKLRHTISSKIFVRLPVTGAPEPSVTTLDETENSALLQCEAHGVPEPEVHWQDSAGNILPAEKPQVTERGGRKYITLNTTVTKTDKFSCVATQKKLSHTISSQIYVLLNEDKPQSDNTGLVVAVVFVSILLVAVVVVLYIREQKHKKELEEKDRIIEELQEKMKKIDEGLQRINTIISEVQEKIKKVAEELQKIIKRLSEANEEIKTIDEGLQKIKTIISEVQENKMSASAACEEIKKIVEELQKIIKHLSEACEEIKTIDEELQKINTIISAACEEIKTIIEELQKIIKHPSAAREKIKKIDEGSSDHPNESVPLNPLNSSV